jgi:nucleoside-triphosphatase
MKKNVLITGAPGCGKTTLVEKVAAALGKQAGGFTTAEIRDSRGRSGFSIRTLDGKEGVLSHIDCKSPHRVGRYGVNIGDIDTIAVPAIQEAVSTGRIVIIDEIARMELFSDTFRTAALSALNSHSRVLATIQMRHDHFLDEIRERPDVTLIILTQENRGQLADTLIREFSEKLPPL